MVWFQVLLFYRYWSPLLTGAEDRFFWFHF